MSSSKPLPSDLSSPVEWEDYLQLQHDMHDFTHIISHDFNAPLRHIKEFTRLLMGSMAPHMGEQEKRYAAIIEHSVEDCQHMLKRLLELSDLSASDESLEIHDVTVLLQKTLQVMASEIARTKAVVRLPKESLMVYGKKTQLLMLFTEIFQNAIDYRLPETSPQILIEYVDAAPLQGVRISDQGAGFATDQSAYAFKMFRRCHHDESEDKRGVGLALCKRIMQLHHGAISLQTAPNEGTVVTCSFPVIASDIE